MGKVRGDILLGSEVPDANFQRKVGYVQQEDIHLATTTVREALDFSARLRRPNDDYRVRLAQVQNILNLLEMTSYADAVVGIPGEGIAAPVSHLKTKLTSEASTLNNASDSALQWKWLQSQSCSSF